MVTTLPKNSSPVTLKTEVAHFMDPAVENRCTIPLSLQRLSIAREIIADERDHKPPVFVAQFDQADSPFVTQLIDSRQSGERATQR
jgi:hypothetical protein